MKKDFGSLMQMMEKVAPAAGFPEVYSLMRTHQIDRRLSEMVRMGLEMLSMTGMTCNEKVRGRLRYVMGNEIADIMLACCSDSYI